MSADFKPMLAKDGDLSKLRYPMLIQPKLDGIRASVVDGRLVSRTLKSIPNREIREALSVPQFEGLDGELIVGDPRADDCYRRTSSYVMAQDKTGEPWTFYVFDVWSSDAPNSVRVDALRTMSPWWPPRVQMVGTMQVDDADELERMEAVLIEQGYEGAILRDPKARYKFGRSGKTGPLIKLKRFIDFEAEVIGVYEEQANTNVATRNALGRTERSSHKAGKVGKGTLGGLVLRALNGPSAGITFHCGTGFTAEQRADYWREWHANLERSAALRGVVAPGAVAKVKSFPIGVKEKPRHPVFLGWRDMSVDG